MSDLRVDIKAACRTARQYAQLIFYHDNFGPRGRGLHPFQAWRNFLGQFSVLPRGAILTLIVGHSFVMEFSRLVNESKERRNVEGESPAQKVEAGCPA